MNKTLFTLALGYVAGIYVASRYPSGRRNLTKMDLREFAQELERIHRDAYSEIESSQLGQDVQAKIAALKSSLEEEAETFAREAEELLERWKKEGTSAVKDIETELKTLYARRRKILADLEDAGIEQISDARNTVTDLGREAIDRLEKQYASLQRAVKSQLGK